MTAMLQTEKNPTEYQHGMRIKAAAENITFVGIVVTVDIFHTIQA